MIRAICLLVTVLASAAAADPPPRPFPVQDADVARYTALRAAGPIEVDGRLDEESWRRAPRSPRFVDMVTGRPVVHDTHAAVVWDDEAMYVGFWVEEPMVQATLTNKGAAIYRENDVEVFIAGRDAYYEFEMNALGTIYEVFFIWKEAYERGGYAAEPTLSMGHPRTAHFDGLQFSPHPRGRRVACLGWEFPGIRTAVFVDGSLNKNDDRDRGWTAELAFPWQGMKWLAVGDGRALPPRDGDDWRIDFSRFNHYRESLHPDDATWGDSGGWVWSKHGIRDSHVPEVFPHVVFSTREVPAGPVDDAVDDAAPAGSAPAP